MLLTERMFQIRLLHVLFCTTSVRLTVRLSFARLMNFPENLVLLPILLLKNYSCFFPFEISISLPLVLSSTLLFAKLSSSFRFSSSTKCEVALHLFNYVDSENGSALEYKHKTNKKMRSLENFKYRLVHLL